MLKNHILLAFRHLKKEKGYTLASIVGLALAFAACFFTFSFVYHEYTADRQFTDKDLTYKLQANDTIDSPIRFSSIPISTAQYMEDHFPEVSVAVPVYQDGGDKTAEIDGKYFVEPRWVSTEPEVVQLFEPDVFNIGRTLTEGTVLLSRSTKERFFGQEEAIGKVITMPEGNYVVAGTFEDFPSNSHLQVNVFCMPLPSREMKYRQGQVYVKVHEGTDMASLLTKVDAESDNMERFLDVIRYKLYSLSDLYLTSPHGGDILRRANTEMIESMSLISMIILFIAGFNIVNLTQVKTLFRGREVGVKKVLGISTGQLFLQFFMEAVAVVLLAGLMAMSLIQVGRGEVLTYLEMDKMYLQEGIGFLMLLMITVASLLGAMQTLLFRRVMPRDVIAGKLKLGEKKWLLKGLVGVQFLVACSLIGSALLVDKQKQHMLSRPVGFKVNDLWYVKMPQSGEDLRLLKDKVAALPGVQGTTISTGLPFVNHGGVMHQDGDKMEFIAWIMMDEDFISTLGISYLNEPLIFPDTGVVVNETLLAREDIDIRKAFGEGVVGSVADFHMGKLSGPVRTLALKPDRQLSYGFLTMRIPPSALSEARKVLEKEWEALYPAYPFELSSLHESYVNAHRKEVELANVLTVLSSIAVCISCIGLASLTGFFVRKRFKEIAIRKVLGATVEQIIRQVNAGYLGWIGGAILLSMGGIYYFGNEWLAKYPYATTVDGWVIAGPSIMLVLIAASIMFVQSWKTAKANPVEALRTE